MVSVDSKFPIAEVVISSNDKVLASLIEEPYSYKWELYDVHNGDYIIKVEVRDKKGLTQTNEITVTVNQAGGGAVEENGAGNMSLYLILALFTVLLVIIFAFGIRKRQKDVGLPPAEGSESSAVLVELTGRNVNKVWQLNAPEIRLGRKGDVNDIPLTGSKASRQMAVIQARENQYIIYSVKSENPVLVNDIPIQRETILRTGDIISMGESVFRYELQNS